MKWDDAERKAREKPEKDKAKPKTDGHGWPLDVGQPLTPAQEKALRELQEALKPKKRGK
jgi:hypothetical protein